MDASGDGMSYDTGRLPARHRALFWREAVCSTFVSVDCRIGDIETFTGTITTRRLADLRISRVRSGPHEVRRSAPYRVSEGTGAVLVGYQRRGTSCIVQDGRTATLKPGQFALYDTARPYELHLGTSCDQIVLSFPADLAEARFGHTRDFTARVVGGSHHLGQTAGVVFRQLSRVDRSSDAMAEHHLRDAASSVIAANVATLIEGLPDPQRSGRALIVMRSKAFIADNIGRDDLTTREIAAAVGSPSATCRSCFRLTGRP